MTEEVRASAQYSCLQRRWPFVCLRGRHTGCRSKASPTPAGQIRLEQVLVRSIRDGHGLNGTAQTHVPGHSARSDASHRPHESERGSECALECTRCCQSAPQYSCLSSRTASDGRPCG